MKRLMEKTVLVGFVTAWRFATVPTRRSPDWVNATTDGVVRPPSAFSMTVGSPPSSTAMQELVVPRSMPIVFAMELCFLSFVVSKEISARVWQIFPAAQGGHAGRGRESGPLAAVGHEPARLVVGQRVGAVEGARVQPHAAGAVRPQGPRPAQREGQEPAADPAPVEALDQAEVRDLDLPARAR